MCARRALRVLTVGVAVVVTLAAVIGPRPAWAGPPEEAGVRSVRVVAPDRADPPAPPQADPPEPLPVPGADLAAPPAPTAAAEPPVPSPPVPPTAPPRPPGAGIPAPGARYSWPLHPPPAVTGAFRQPTFRYGPGHRGADLAAGAGQAVLAAREGTVAFAGPVAGRGVVSVDHPDGLRSTYEPVTATVTAGSAVTAGDPLGVLQAGHPGCPVAACLHWGVRRDRLDHLDPLVLLRPPGVRLLPWEGAAPG